MEKFIRLIIRAIGDIVTEADKTSEKLITERLESRFPDYAILGEEFGMSNGTIG